MAKKFDIIVRENDLDHGMHVHRETGVMANSAQELKMLYGMSDQTIQIEREYEDDESRNYGNGKNVTHMSDVTKTTENKQLSIPNSNVQIEKENVVYVEKKEPPKYFEIGGIKCKMEDGKMYQKQWMRLSDVESSEFRIVSDKNNKICPLKDKHIEIMKWVLVQDENTDTCNNVKNGGLELLND